MLEPVTVKNYSSERGFHLHDASWSGGTVTLHSFGSLNVGDAIDLIFLGTDYIEFPCELNGLTISQPCDDLAVQYEQRFGRSRKLERPEGKRVFAIESSGNRFHVIAAKLWILTRTHDSQLAAKILLSDNPAEKAAFLEGHVKDWRKMTALENDD